MYQRKQAYANKSIVVGRNPVIESLESDKAIERIYINSKASGQEIAKIISLAKHKEVPIFFVPSQKLDGLTRAYHQGVLALLSVVSFQSLQNLIDFSFQQGKTPAFVVMDRITDVRNLGAIARTAYGAGFTAIVVTQKGVPPIQEDTIKTSAGALLHLPVVREASLKFIFNILKLNGIEIVASDKQGKVQPYQYDFKNAFAIVMGNEEEGIESEVLNQCDASIKLPMMQEFDSYNVASSFAMYAYEYMRQQSI